ncbi:MAG: hypothetical protein IPG93_14920 [Burkholderiales bacterium]|nr:hypothetical protein [Burkholderiales bacterium]
MEQPALTITLAFSPDDQAWIRRSKVEVPSFWAHHHVPPATGDVLRIGGRQFLIKGRLWEQEGSGVVLRLFLSSAYAQSDTVFGENLG